MKRSNIKILNFDAMKFLIRSLSFEAMKIFIFIFMSMSGSMFRDTDTDRNTDREGAGGVVAQW
jgi:hypothetical protein